MQFDFVIVGSGLTGATIARLLSDKGFKVVVLERRSHIGGNIYDYVHESGIRIHAYGPHYFRTSSEIIWEFVTRFSQFYTYNAQIKTLVDGHLENWPISSSYIKRLLGNFLSLEFTGAPTNFEEACLALMPRVVYEKFVKGYSEKQWGVAAPNLSTQLVKRFDIRKDDNPFLTPHHKYQGLPQKGYTTLIKNMLEGVPVILSFDYLKDKNKFEPRNTLVFTGPIDEYFNFELGKLLYRGQKRENIYLADTNFYQSYAQINNPNFNNGSYIRTLEWKHMMEPETIKGIKGTVITRETAFTPSNPQHYEYPFPDETNADLYRRYLEKAMAVSKLFICGRLGDYRYYDMDQAIGRAMKIAERLAEKGWRLFHKEIHL